MEGVLALRSRFELHNDAYAEFVRLKRCLITKNRGIYVILKQLVVLLGLVQVLTHVTK